MTTTTPESRARIAYVAYCRGEDGSVGGSSSWALFDDLSAEDKARWVKAARAIWELATTGRTSI